MIDQIFTNHFIDSEYSNIIFFKANSMIFNLYLNVIWFNTLDIIVDDLLCNFSTNTPSLNPLFILQLIR